MRLKVGLGPALHVGGFDETIPVDQPWTHPCADVYKRSPADNPRLPLHGGRGGVRFIQVNRISMHQAAGIGIDAVGYEGPEIELRGQPPSFRRTESGLHVA